MAIKQEFKVPTEASLLSGIGNLTNTIVGSGMLGLPFALASSGIFAGAILFAIAASASIFGLHLLSVAAQKVYTSNQPSSYFVVAKKTFPEAALLIDFAVAIKCFGVSISYLIVIGRLMPDAMETLVPDSDVVGERVFWLGLSIVLCLPLSLLQSINSLRFTSYIALGSVVYVLVLVLVYFIKLENGISLTTLKSWPSSPESFFSNIPIFIFAFTCHQNLFSIQNEMSGKREKVRPVIVISVLISLFVYILLGYCGYLTYKDKVKDNIIDNLPQDTPVTLCRFAVTILVVFSYPLQIHPCRTSILNLVGVITPRAKSKVVTYITTIILCTITYTVAFFVDDLGIVFNIVGASGSVTLCYILPGAFYVKMYWDKPWGTKKIFALILGLGGVLLMVNSLFWISYEKITKDPQTNPIIPQSI